MTGLVTSGSDDLSGKMVLPDGQETRFTARKTGSYEEAPKKDSPAEKEAPVMIPLSYPNVGYGYRSLL